ncbi:hypothetical protein HDU79_004566 [Rhizoclosmatium sp. JEL0117]|nr:hypothetical protein HDU79_004566 [Rhizoclosmatium sp. JEL0117]
MSQLLLSSVHGRDRRKLRQIGKKDLLAAVKHGVKERAMPCRRTGAKRWKFTFANIVYITDETCTQEITSYVQAIDIQPVPIDTFAELDHDRLQKKLDAHPELCSSHTVLVVDMSGSMKTSDVDNFRTRADAVYGTLALDFVGAQLDQGLLRGTDVVSVIEMRDEAEVVLEREPITNVLFNKLIERRTKSKPASHGNYVNAFKAAQELFEVDEYNETCALLLIFLSDGKPSDQVTKYSGQSVQDLISTRIASMALDFGNRLILGTVGFAKDQDFSVLDQMAKDATHLDLLVEKESFEHDIGKLSSHGWHIYKGMNVYSARWSPNEKDWNYYPLKAPIAGFAVRRRIFGEGAERIVFQLVNIDLNNEIIGDPLVAKDSRFVHEDEGQKMEFHQVFCETQLKAAELAIKFNSHLSMLGNYKFFPRIKFLDCFVYEYVDDESNDTVRGLLVEKMLNHTKYKKWNGNDGSVDGINHTENVTIEELFENLNIGPAYSAPVPRPLGSVERRSVVASSSSGKTVVQMAANHSDFPQAFSHWTYRNSNREFLVCDLQGVLDTTVYPPVFEFTDPAIHSSSSKKRSERKFGRTDRGKFGIIDFFKTHQCNDVCRLLGLPSDH